jgi:arylsulfatase A-like enzyme
MVTSRRIYTAAWMLLALGIAWQLAPGLEKHVSRLRRILIGSFPVLAALVLIAAGFVFGSEWLSQRRQATRPLPRPDCPNVLLIVLDTVRADHLSLYGYARPTSPALVRLAARGIRFDAARATAPWTLPSHASLFSGRLPHEHKVQWKSPLGARFPMLAEHFASRGYATAGFVANTTYCSSETGLDRGFAHYEDYRFERLSWARTACLVEEFLKSSPELFRPLNADLYYAVRELIHEWFFAGNRKDASLINREFLGWLSRRADPGRPFFVFLNYYDAHTPYLVPPGALYRFGSRPRTRDEMLLLSERWVSLDKRGLPERYRALARDCYDSCIAYLDEQLGLLFDDLARRDLLERTMVIVTADHGEGLGEHELFDHGESLYRTEIRVPLLILPPRAHPFRAGAIEATVSLRDLPATVVDVAGLASAAPFPGRSLAGLWQEPSPGTARGAAVQESAVSELEIPNPSRPNQGRSPASKGALASLAQGDFVYIRNDGDGTEELFNEREDPRELSNLARAPTMQSLLQRFHEELDRIRSRPP